MGVVKRFVPVFSKILVLNGSVAVEKVVCTPDAISVAILVEVERVVCAPDTISVAIFVAILVEVERVVCSPDATSVAMLVAILVEVERVPVFVAVEVKVDVFVFVP